MKVGRYEFGLVKPLRWNRFWKTAAENPCGCTIWEFGFWYFTILRYECAGEVDTRVVEPKTPVQEAMLGLAAQIERSLYMTPVADMKTYTFDEDEPLAAKAFKLKKKPKKRKDSLKAAIKTAKSLETTKIKLTKKEKKKLTKNLLKKSKKKKV